MGVTISYSFSWAIHEESCSDIVIYVVSIQAVFAPRVMCKGRLEFSAMILLHKTFANIRWY